jgi:Ca2+-binding EF-hand superfamily protein
MNSKDLHPTRVFFGTLLAGFMATTALGAETPSTTPAAPPGRPHGEIDLVKANERATAIFVMVDTNGDGEITEIEFMATKPPHDGPRDGHRMGMGMGMDGLHGGFGGRGPDGALTPEQRDAQTQAFEAELFSALDADHDGQLSPVEFSKSREVARNLMKKQMFTKSDKNGDGVLTKDEFPPFVSRMTAMDTNGDGTVTRDEMKAARAARGTQTASPQN